MIHIKTFSQIFEDAEYWSPDPSVYYPIEQIRSLDSYKDLISKYGWIDTTTDRVAKSGNVTFEHPVLPGIRYQICLLYTSPSPRDRQKSRMPSSA